MPKYYEGQFLKFIGNALKENAVILTCMFCVFSHHINGKFCHRNAT